MDEQVVPSFVPRKGPSVSTTSLRRTTSLTKDLTALVPSGNEPAQVGTGPSAPTRRSKPLVPHSPAIEFAGKLRWETPLRSGKWREAWQGARELGLPVCVRSSNAAGIGAVIRACLADTVVAYVGPQLPRPTVEKWLCLLCEYLELNADEQVLVVCILKRYVRRGGRFVGRGDWARPQRWECVVAVACYLAVLLTEEFPGRTAMDLRELLGPNFRFGNEQVNFLKVVDWRVSVDAEDFTLVKNTCEAVLAGDAGARQLIATWFMVDKAVEDRKRLAAEEAAAAAAAAAAAVVASPVSTPTMSVGKKRGFASIAPADDSVVPRVVVPRLDGRHVHAPTVQTVPTAFVSTVPHWAPHW